MEWEKIILIYLALAKFITALRDVLDNSPETDDNWIERACSVVKKLGEYMVLGKRPQ